MEKVIFSIDFENNPHRMNIFKNYIAENHHRMNGNVVDMIGCYKGKREHCFICRLDDFDQLIRGSAFIAGQESILLVASGNKMEVGLEYLKPPVGFDDWKVVDLGCMHEVCREEAMQAENWSYRPDLDVYWIAKKGNPDDSYRKSVAKFRDKQDPHLVNAVAALAAE